MATNPDLPKERFRAFLRTYADERGWGWQTALAERLGVHQTYIGRLHKAEQQPSLDEVHAAMRVFKIDPGFFFDASLGPDPDYRDHRAGAQETRVDRAEGAVQALETLIAERAEMGRPVSPTVAERARRAARSAGIETRGEASLLVETLELVEARERRERSGLIEPAPADARARVDEARGQRPASPARFKRARSR